MASYNIPKQVNGEINPIYNPDDYNTVPDTVRIDNQATNYINNNPFKKIKLSSTWVAYGDSYTSGGDWSPTWATYLQNLTGKTVINKAVFGTNSDYVNAELSDDFITNPDYASYTSILMYGFNDVRNIKAFYSNSYAWTQHILATVLGLSLPQNRIHDPRHESWIKTGTWENTSQYNFGMYNTTVGGSLEKNVGTARYISVRHSLIHMPSAFSLYANGNLINKFQWDTTTMVSQYSIRCGAYIIDLGEEIENCTIKIQNNGTAGLSFVDFIAAWTDADLVNARSVLLLSIARSNFEFAGPAASIPTQTLDAKRILMNEGYEQVALICTRLGLPVSFFKISETQGNLYSDNLHPTTTMSRQWAQQILDNAIY